MIRNSLYRRGADWKRETKTECRQYTPRPFARGGRAYECTRRVRIARACTYEYTTRNVTHGHECAHVKRALYCSWKLGFAFPAENYQFIMYVQILPTAGDDTMKRRRVVFYNNALKHLHVYVRTISRKISFSDEVLHTTRLRRRELSSIEIMCSFTYVYT